MNKPEESGRLSLWGVGNQGSRVISCLPEEIRRRVNPVVVDSDIQSLICGPQALKIRIEPPAAGGAPPGDPERLKKAFRENEEKIRQQLSGIRTLVVIGGLGGLVASTLIPAICRLARQLKIFTLVLATRPFAFEGKKRARVFAEAEAAIEKYGVGLACFSLDRLIGKIADDTPHQEVFHRCDRVLEEAVECVLANLSTPPDQGEARSGLGDVFAGPGQAVIGEEEAPRPEDLVKAAKAALSSLALTPAELAALRGVLIQIAGPDPLPFRPIQKAIDSVSRLLNEDTELLYTVTRRENPEAKTCFRLLAAGVPPAASRGGADAFPVTLNRGGRRPRQEEIDFNKCTRGIFAKSEPTSRDGEDLDIPTFIRQGVQLGGDGEAGG